MAADAAGLGKVTVLSALGQPLRAEVEVFASREELAGMKAQLASQDAFRQAGVEYAPTLLGIAFTVGKRPNGQTILRLSSDKPINDPFIDLLLELNWATGRVVREYTFLLDPVEFAAKTAAATAPAVARPVAALPASGEARAGDRPVRVERYNKSRGSEQAPQTADGGGTYEVRRGETLGKIASELRPDGVSLDQMLVGLFQANQDAFDRGNMNRLKAGRILAVPDKASLGAIPRDEASRMVIAQSSDWGGYRRKLAAVAADAPVVDEAARQQAGGKITARVADKASPSVEPKDQLKVSKTELPGGKPVVATAKRTDEDLIAKEKALKDANERLASLERNVAELQRLVELKSQSLADLEKQSAAKGVPAVEAKKSVEDTRTPPVAPIVAPVSTPAAPPGRSEASPPAVPLPAATPVEKPAEQAPEVKPAEAKPEPKPEEPKPEVKEEAPKPAEVPKAKIVVPPPAPEEPGFLEELLTRTPVLLGAAGILALLAAYWFSRRRHRSESERSLESTSTLAPQGESVLVANSVFRSTGGQSVDTSHSMAQTDFSQAGPGSIDTDDVDPVAEADVYMAYGRDAQAEEILLEAKQKEPQRYAIHLKLLEIYLSRRDARPFDTLATELFAATGGVGADWEKAAAMGLQMDPRSRLYGATEIITPSSPDVEATIIVPKESAASLQDTVSKPGQLSQMAAAAAVANVLSGPSEEGRVAAAAAAEPIELAGLDFDLGLGHAEPVARAAAEDAYLETTLSFPSPAPGETLDFDLAASLPLPSAPPIRPVPPADDLDDLPPRGDIEAPEITILVAPGSLPGALSDDTGLDFEFDLGAEWPTDPEVEKRETAEARAPAPTEPDELVDVGSAAGDALEFDVTLTESTILGESMQHPSYDMSSISLDLADVDGLSPAAARVTGDSPDLSFDAEQEDTLVNPGFPAEQTDAELNAALRSDMGDMDLVAEPEISSSEELATKLDLAKAYEEMGDLEGARELLQEVLKDGDAAQREAALAILAGLRE
ncbi:FimV/HubP family polar landmark protein [Candidatus Accumulibacter aalborgensis]|uniref:FimV/HubP family polar landmark protein n=1 Tax=Candidatus Accumulibacter aalborgensis TaxID=1860102 RepID=UPI0016458A41|nr:FimV/HubP family polar landmark protein [Candidatus Accumulibacter aalborgensis]